MSERIPFTKSDLDYLENRKENCSSCGAKRKEFYLKGRRYTEIFHKPDCPIRHPVTGISNANGTLRVVKH